MKYITKIGPDGLLLIPADLLDPTPEFVQISTQDGQIVLTPFDPESGQQDLELQARAISWYENLPPALQDHILLKYSIPSPEPHLLQKAYLSETL